MKKSISGSLGKGIIVISCFQKLKATYLSAIVGMMVSGSVFLCKKNLTISYQKSNSVLSAKVESTTTASVNGVMIQGFYWNVPQSISLVLEILPIKNC